jgi:hypothetical protein
VKKLVCVKVKWVTRWFYTAAKKAHGRKTPQRRGEKTSAPFKFFGLDKGLKMSIM